jgi:pimeloyl-ACP methyl ester carboxylesterase/DNA-binding CsgD family transcriptional regulator
MASTMDAPPVQYVTTSDGYNIAYAVSGEGQPFVLMPPPFSHIQLYWTEHTWVRPWLEGLSARFRFIQYDGRGQGMSQRGLASSHRLTDNLRDLEAVVERLSLDQFVLMAVSSTGHVAVAYAATHPARVKALILDCCAVSESAWPMGLFQMLPSQNWELFLRSQAPEGQSVSEAQRMVSRLKQTVTQRDWEIRMDASLQARTGEFLASLTMPTLVLRPRDFVQLPMDEAVKLAGGIRNSSLVLIDGATILGDAASGLQAIGDFLATLQEASSPAGARRASLEQAARLSSREIEVLRLIAIGRSNQQIADALVISLFTVNRHVSNIFTKTGAANRAEAASYATRQGLV